MYVYIYIHIYMCIYVYIYIYIICIGEDLVLEAGTFGLQHARRSPQPQVLLQVTNLPRQSVRWVRFIQKRVRTRYPLLKTTACRARIFHERGTPGSGSHLDAPCAVGPEALRASAYHTQVTNLEPAAVCIYIDSPPGYQPATPECWRG